MGWALHHVCLLAGLAPTMIAGCHLAGPSRAPAPEHALAIEGEPQPADSLAGSSAAPTEPNATGDVAGRAFGGSAPQTDRSLVDEEPDLLPEASAEDDHTDEPPGEGPPSAPSLDRGGMPVASRYAGLDRTSCEAELVRRHIAFDRVGEARGVVAPLRLRGPLSGVTFRSNLPASKSRTSPYDIYDCRLVLALDDFARVLARHDIVEVIHLSVYRPVSSKVALKGAGRRHGGALAIDAAIFKTKDGRSLSVEKDFHPRRIGARPCPAPESASELRKIACEANDARLFNVLLTPDFNWAHRNHFHMEVTAGVRWTLVR